METRFKEEVLRTSNLYEMQEKFLAERLLRTWKEDFVDEDNGEVVTIERNEIILNRGVLIDSDTLSIINFHLQSGDIKDVLVSNQKRTGIGSKGYMSVYCVTIVDGKKKKNFYLYSDSVVMAIEIITDYLEQKIEGAFSLFGVKEVGYSNLLDLEDEDLGEDFYKIEIEITYDESESHEHTFILRSDNADQAKDNIAKHISLQRKKDDEEREFEIKIISAKKLPCNNIIDFKFTKDYVEKEKEAV